MAREDGAGGGKEGTLRGDAPDAPGTSSSHDEEGAPARQVSRSSASHRRLRALFDEYFDFVWRSLRRFGLADHQADDAAQRVYEIAANKLDAIEPGRERSFLIAIAVRVASDLRRSAPVRREVPHADLDAELEDPARPDDLLEQRRARAMLDEVLDTMDLDLRSVFVLFEVEEMTTREIAALLGLPRGTVASRLRRAREEFTTRLESYQRARDRAARMLAQGRRISGEGGAQS